MTRARQIRRSPVAATTIQFIFCRQRRLAARRRRGNRRRIVHRKAVTPPWNKPCCCKSSGRRSTASVHDPRVSSQSSAPTWRMNPWRDALADSLRDRREVGIEVRGHDMPPVSKQPPVRPGLGSRRRSECRSDAWIGTVATRQPRATEDLRRSMIWLKNSVDVIAAVRRARSRARATSRCLRKA